MKSQTKRIIEASRRIKAHWRLSKCRYGILCDVLETRRRCPNTYRGIYRSKFGPPVFYS